MMKDHYQTLGIKSNATAEELKVSYRKLVVKFHPDKNPGDHFSEERFLEIQEAYNILSNAKKRKMFDLFRDNLLYEETNYIRKDDEESIVHDLEYRKTNITLAAVLIIAITFLAILLTI